MAKPSIQNITVTQTFQNWFDKTNEIVDIFRDEALTASPGGDTTNGNAILNGNFTATDIIATGTGRFDTIDLANNSLSAITVVEPINIVASEKIVETLTHVADGPQLRFTDNTNTWDIGFKDSTAAFVINTGVGDKFNLSTAGTLAVPNIIVEGLEVTGDLLVGGDVRFEGSDVTITANTTISGNFTLPVDRDATFGDIYAENIRANGEVVTNYSASDLRLKENLEIIPDALDKVSRVNGYTFNYINKPEERVTGIVAQEIEDIIPGIVFDVSDEAGNFKAVRYGHIVALLIEAVKELKDEVERLKNGTTN